MSTRESGLYSKRSTARHDLYFPTTAGHIPSYESNVLAVQLRLLVPLKRRHTPRRAVRRPAARWADIKNNLRSNWSRRRLRVGCRRGKRGAP